MDSQTMFHFHIQPFIFQLESVQFDSTQEAVKLLRGVLADVTIELNRVIEEWEDEDPDE